MTRTSGLRCPHCAALVDDLTQGFIALPVDQMPDNPAADTWEANYTPDPDAPDGAEEPLPQRAQGVIGWRLTPCGHAVRGDHYVITLADPLPPDDDPVSLADLNARFTLTEQGQAAL